MKKLLLIVLLLASCGGNPTTQNDDGKVMNGAYMNEARDAFNRTVGMANEDTNFQYDYRTPQGIEVKSVVPVPPEFLNRADAGVQRQIERLSRIFPNWSNTHARVSDYKLFIVNPNRTYDPDGHASPPCENHVNEPGSPCIFVQGVQAAGTIIGYDDRWNYISIYPAIVVPHQANQNWRFPQYFEDSVHNESEHIRSWICRRLEPTGVFYWFQGANDVHPFQWGNEPLGIKSRVPSACLPKLDGGKNGEQAR